MYDWSLRPIAFVIGLFGLIMFFRSILRVAVLHIRKRDWIAINTAKAARAPILYFARKRRDYGDVQNIMVWAFPSFILCLIAVYFLWVQVSFTLLIWAVEPEKNWLKAFIASGSALSTLGFATPTSTVGQLFAIWEGAFGLGIIVFMFTFIPSYRAAIQAREDLVEWLFTRVGARPTVFSLIVWCQEADQWEDFPAIMDRGESWFRALLATHLLTPALAFVPEEHQGRTWVGAAVCMLDAGSFVLSSLNVKALISARTCRETGVDALRQIAGELRPFTNVVRVTNGGDNEFAAAYDAAYENLRVAGMPMKPNRDECRVAFVSLRSTYVASVREIAAATLMPIEEPWVLPRG
jgi:hypothetical protein